jgi:hypothetical protein
MKMYYFFYGVFAAAMALLMAPAKTPSVTLFSVALFTSVFAGLLQEWLNHRSNHKQIEAGEPTLYDACGTNALIASLGGLVVSVTTLL